MGWFTPKVPNTVSDKQMADLSRRARKADKEPWLGKKATGKRLASENQRRKSGWN